MRFERKVGDLIGSIFHKMELDELADELEVVRVYRGVVGDLISRLTTEIHYQKGELRVRYASAALRTEMSFKKQDLINKINEVMGRRVLTKITLL